MSSEPQSEYCFEQIAVPSELASDYRATEPGNRITGLKRLNAFVGPNNSGKSRVLRTLFSTPNMVSTWSTELSREFLLHQSQVLEIYAASGIETEPRKRAEERILSAFPPLFSKDGQRTNDPQPASTNEVNLWSNRHQCPFSWPPEEHHQSALSATVRKLRNVYRDLHLEKKSKPSGHCQFVYVPTLRGLRAPSTDKDFYFRRTHEDYFAGKTRFSRKLTDRKQGTIQSAQVVTGLELYDEIQQHLLGTLTQRTQIAEFEQYLAASFFDNRPVSLIPRINDSSLHIKVGNERERPVHELGDGLQQILILTLPLFLHRAKPLLMFVEEPELYLHPGFQRKFIDTVLQDDGACRQVFVTTHSNHFLDITVDSEKCSIYRFTKDIPQGNEDEADPKFSIENVTAGETTLLADIGVRASSVFLANCAIWVEGITDRLYLQRYLDLYMGQAEHSFIENLHYVFVEYGGGNITHWSFLAGEEGMSAERTCADIFLVTDRDSDKEDRHKRLRDNLGDRFYRLACREIENLLTPDVISAVVKSYEGDDVVLNTVNRDAYADKYLGRFIETHILPDGHTSRRPVRTGSPYKDKSGTVKNKPEFCRRAIQHINSLEDLSEEATDLTGRIYSFIKMNNA